MFTENARTLIGYAILCALAAAVAASILIRNRHRFKEICTDENGKWDPIGGIGRYLSKDGMPDDPGEAPQDVSPDEDLMALLMRQEGARMRDFDPDKDLIREHIIFSGRVQGVGFRYQAMVAAREYGLTGWVENLPDGSVEMEVQGTPAAIGKMMRYLRSGHWIRIDDMDMESLPVIPGERGFGVKGY